MSRAGRLETTFAPAVVLFSSDAQLKFTPFSGSAWTWPTATRQSEFMVQLPVEEVPVVHRFVMVSHTPVVVMASQSMTPETALVVVKGWRLAPVLQVSPSTVQSVSLSQSPIPPIPPVPLGEHLPGCGLQFVLWTLIKRFNRRNVAWDAQLGDPVPFPGTK